MKKLLLTALSAVAMLQVGAQSKYKISGQIKNFEGKYIYLHKFTGTSDQLDSVLLKNGKFSFSVPVSNAEMIAISGTSKFSPAWKAFFMDTHDLTFTASGKSWADAVIKGSAANNIYNEWDAEWEAIRQDAGKLYKMLDSAGKLEDKSAGEALRKKGEDGFAALDQRMADAVTKIVDKYPNSPVSAYVIVDRYVNYPNTERAVKEYAKLGAQAKASFYGKKIEEYLAIEQKTAIGKTIELSLPDVNGKMVSLSDYKGKIVMVDFWASWCGPCRKENPNVVKAYKAFHDKGFEIVGVSLDDKKANWLKAIDADGLSWKHVSDLKGWKGEYVGKLGIRAVPTNFILDENGKIIAKNLRGEELYQKLEEIFN
ncbi:hypothetical protein COR50_02125 [Chitinophaga caeni]|uniref:Thioredoxin domain-containing protein n=1 Tax=Chitinophaga caeni TaxID=2029983 RepID=A0A291QQE1_9BACT|nr:TlpA disulfide reductase family protein [Chitinophaga caeni]ATL46054.1 hypothetical protein COR50_02125 [Chitinophaga caeni]